jgi:hypothetical protein
MNPGPSLVVMNVAALRPLSLRSLVSSPHRGLVEGATLISLYGVYELIRGGGHTTLGLARRHTDSIVSLERHLHVFGERALQHASHSVPALPSVLGVAYMALHFGVTIGFLFWLYRRHRERFPLIRNTVVVATAIALVIYVLYPAAPPRLAGLGFVDTVTNGAHLNLSSNLLGSVYNPFAAVPSLHFGYALIVGVAVAAYAGRRSVRIAGAVYPLVMLVVIVATGNHFFFDAAAGGLVVAVGYLVARALEARARQSDAQPSAHSEANRSPWGIPLARIALRTASTSYRTRRNSTASWPSDGVTIAYSANGRNGSSSGGSLKSYASPTLPTLTQTLSPRRSSHWRWTWPPATPVAPPISSLICSRGV